MAERIVVVLGGLNSRSGFADVEPDLRADFELLRAAVKRLVPEARFVSFSYRSAGSAGWIGGDWDGEADPIYRPAETTDLPLAVQVARLDDLVAQIIARYPGARVDLAGFSLGGAIAAAWAGAARIPAQIGQLALISAPVGGITPLCGLAGNPAVAAALRQFDIDFGSSAVFADLQPGSPWLAAMEAGVRRLPTVAVENAADYVTNGRRICGQVLFPQWVRTISLGRGAWASGLLPERDIYWRDLGGWDRELRRTHHLILRARTPEVLSAWDWLADRLAGEFAYARGTEFEWLTAFA